MVNHRRPLPFDLAASPETSRAVDIAMATFSGPPDDVSDESEGMFRGLAVAQATDLALRRFM